MTGTGSSTTVTPNSSGLSQQPQTLAPAPTLTPAAAAAPAAAFVKLKVTPGLGCNGRCFMFDPISEVCFKIFPCWENN